MAEGDTIEVDPPGFRFWKWTGLFGTGHTTYATGVLEGEGPFSNPARMIEDVMGHSPDPELLDGRSLSEFWASVWAHAGWFDKAYAR